MRNVVVGTLAAVLSVGLLFIYNKKKQARKLEREVALTIAKKIKQDMYTILFDIANFVQQHSQQIPPEQLRKVVLSEQSSLTQRLTGKLQQIYKEYNTSEQEFENNITNYYKRDQEIQYHINKYRQSYQKALLGIQPPFKEDAATFMCREKVLEAVELILKDKLEVLFTIMGNVSDMQGLLEALESDKKKEKARKMSILNRFGLLGKEKQISQIFEFCVAKYVRIGEQFARRYRSAIAKYESQYTQAISNKIQELSQS